ncbi:MAG: type I pantothenate kinase [Wigglesworthia glossinidia]|nr:type I pantothenate kinase [Wigglesworthia glossinidia]
MKTNQETYVYLAKVIYKNFLSKIKKSQIKYGKYYVLDNLSPYIVSIYGSVASGKSTIACILKTYLANHAKNITIEIVQTDVFLYCNQVLNKMGLMQKKGFPESYDIRKLSNFLINFKKYKTSCFLLPQYSHIEYDILPTKKLMFKTHILILEGLNFLYNKKEKNFLFINDIDLLDLIDFNIYIDAKENYIKDWYINRFLSFRKKSTLYPCSYFARYLNISEEKVIEKANSIWNYTNRNNLIKNILPLRKYANLIVKKNYNHTTSVIIQNKCNF